MKAWQAKNTKTRDHGTKRKQSETDSTSSLTAKELRSTIASVFREESSKQQKRQKKDEEEINTIRDLLVTFQNSNGKSAKSTSASASASATTSATSNTATALATQLQGILKQGSDSKKSE